MGRRSQPPLSSVPENGAVSEKMVQQAAFEAQNKGYAHLYVIGFAIQPNARTLIEDCDAVMSIPATYVQATPDLMMGDLLKHMRSSQIFSVCGLPEIKLIKETKNGGRTKYQVELLGLDLFDPVAMEPLHLQGRRRSRLVSRYGLQRAVLSRDAGVFSAHGRLGQSAQGAEGNLRRIGLGPSGGDGQRAVRGRRASRDRGQGD